MNPELASAADFPPLTPEEAEADARGEIDLLQAFWNSVTREACRDVFYCADIAYDEAQRYGVSGGRRSLLGRDQVGGMEFDRWLRVALGGELQIAWAEFHVEARRFTASRWRPFVHLEKKAELERAAARVHKHVWLVNDNEPPCRVYETALGRCRHDLAIEATCREA